MIAVVALSVYGSYLSVALACVCLVMWAPISLTTFAKEAYGRLTGTTVIVSAIYGYLLPILGVMMMASSTMYMLGTPPAAMGAHL